MVTTTGMIGIKITEGASEKEVPSVNLPNEQYI
jgi:hypothetical protein